MRPTKTGSGAAARHMVPSELIADPRLRRGSQAQRGTYSTAEAQRMASDKTRHGVPSQRVFDPRLRRNAQAQRRTYTLNEFQDIHAGVDRSAPSPDVTGGTERIEDWESGGRRRDQDWNTRSGAEDWS